MTVFPTGEDNREFAANENLKTSLKVFCRNEMQKIGSVVLELLVPIKSYSWQVPRQLFLLNMITLNN